MYLAHLQNWLDYGHSLLIFQILAYFWHSETCRILGFRACSGERIENDLKSCMRMYLNHLPNWLVYAHNLLIFLILALFRLNVTCQIWGFQTFPGEHMEGMAWNLACCCIPVTFRTDEIISWSCDFLILPLFWFSETGQIWGCRLFLEEHMEGISWKFACWFILTTFRTD